MLIKNQDKIFRRIAVAFTELGNPLDGFTKDRIVKSFRIGVFWREGLLDTDIGNEATEGFDFPEQAVREMSESRYARTFLTV